MRPESLVKHLGKPGEPGAISRSEASSKGARIKALTEHPGWSDLVELIEGLQHHEQKRLMRDPRAKEDDAYERVFGMWQGMDRVPLLAQGMIAVGEGASREMESGMNAAEAAAS
jgi:hypothetical protein